MAGARVAMEEVCCYPADFNFRLLEQMLWYCVTCACVAPRALSPLSLLSVNEATAQEARALRPGR